MLSITEYSGQNGRAWVCTVLLPLMLQLGKPTLLLWYFSCYRCTPMRLQNGWFDLKVNQDSLGELKGTIGDNLPFTAVPEYPSFPRPCFLFDSKRMLLQCSSSRFTFVVIYWASLFSLKIRASFGKRGKVKLGIFSWSLSLFFLRYSLLPLWPGELSFFSLSAKSRLSEAVQEIW